MPGCARFACLVTCGKVDLGELLSLGPQQLIKI
jgi:hypothetical protein